MRREYALKVENWKVRNFSLVDSSVYVSVYVGARYSLPGCINHPPRYSRTMLRPNLSFPPSPPLTHHFMLSLDNRLREFIYAVTVLSILPSTSCRAMERETEPHPGLLNNCGRHVMPYYTNFTLRGKMVFVRGWIWWWWWWWWVQGFTPCVNNNS